MPYRRCSAPLVKNHPLHRVVPLQRSPAPPSHVLPQGNLGGVRPAQTPAVSAEVLAVLPSPLAVSVLPRTYVINHDGDVVPLPVTPTVAVMQGPLAGQLDGFLALLETLTQCGTRVCLTQDLILGKKMFTVVRLVNRRLKVYILL